MASSTQSSPLLRLPAEIRLRIYEYLEQARHEDEGRLDVEAQIGHFHAYVLALNVVENHGDDLSALTTFFKRFPEPILRYRRMLPLSSYLGDTTTDTFLSLLKTCSQTRQETAHIFMERFRLHALSASSANYFGAMAPLLATYLRSLTVKLPGSPFGSAEQVHPRDLQHWAMVIQRYPELEYLEIIHAEMVLPVNYEAEIEYNPGCYLKELVELIHEKSHLKCAWSFTDRLWGYNDPLLLSFGFRSSKGMGGLRRYSASRVKTVSINHGSCDCSAKN